MVEMIVAISVLTVGVFGALQLYHVGLRRSHEMQQHQAARLVLDNALEELRAMAGGNLESGPLAIPPAVADQLEEASGEVVVRTHGVAGLREVTVRLAYVSYLGRAVELRETALVGDAW
jgi:hypothetical protein